MRTCSSEKGSVSVCSGCHNEAPQVGGFHTEMDFLRSGGWQSNPAVGSPLLLLTDGGLLAVHVAFPPCTGPGGFSSNKDTSPTG